jgi:IS5 family transposase
MQSSFFDLDKRYAHLSKTGDPLERLSRAIDWELFRPLLDRIDDKPRKNNAGRKPTDRVLMFKMLVLQTKYRLSDEQLEYQVTDRLSFMRFLGVLLAGDVPDARTVWAFRDALKEAGLVELLFERFNQALADLGVQMTSGQIIDATFVPVPIQRNGREDNALIKADAVPVEWGKNKAKLAQKDTDARWTKKGGQDHYGYKNHINIDRATKLIAAHVCTSACVHDSQVLDAVLREAQIGGKEVWADSAYRSAEQEHSLAGRAHHSRIHERAYRNKPLTETQETSNTEKSRIRARVEHVFGYQENSMGGIGLRTIGMARAVVGIGMMNLVYNLCRVEMLIRYRVFDFDRVGASSAPQTA